MDYSIAKVLCKHQIISLIVGKHAIPVSAHYVDTYLYARKTFIHYRNDTKICNMNDNDLIVENFSTNYFHGNVVRFFLVLNSKTLPCLRIGKSIFCSGFYCLLPCEQILH